MITKGEIKWLLACAALAAGEGLAASFPSGAEAWGYFALAALVVALVGYGLAFSPATFLAIFLLGLAAFFLSTRESERRYRETPWLRGARVREAARAESSPLKRDLSRRVGLGLDHARETVVLNRAILLGERAAIPGATKKAFIESGTIHVFAISGLHVMIVAKVLMMLVALIFIPYRFQGAIAILPVWGYVALIGAPPSALRAATMASVYFLAPLFLRRSNGLVAWSIAFLALHLLFPAFIINTGSQLSYLVMLGILLAGRVALSPFAVTCAAWAASLPIAAMAFGRITPGGLLANLVLIAAATGSVAAGALGVAVSFLSTTLAVHLNNLSALMTDFMVAISEAVSRLPFSNFETARWSLLMCFEWYLAFALVLYLAFRHRTRGIL